MRPVLARAAVTLVAVVVLVPLPVDSASADCATGVLQFDDGRTQLSVVPGEVVTLTSAGYVKGCDDGGDRDVGCSAPLHERPREDIELRLRQGGEERPLATVDAQNEGDDVGLVSWTVTIPVDAIAGRATFVPDGGQPLTVRVVPE
ncbi:MAG: hypothetical protein F2829_15335 [Actinobacteria bacterium]|uniref:hypothetical protein n=1 Tax=Nocardioides sp. S5 TaxID=2017486 RepID=UPI0013FC0CE7|nr:hypothetical protein [Nocardioides sp. S5]MSW71418.1 hypothetical protein [Actinomycetota bacterium]QSR31294.1 hypothetical protein CFI00_12415 [Nocardioides sp. S5]